VPRRTALALVGVGRYADPWHPFVDTASVVIDLLAARGFEVDTATDVDEALAEYADPAKALPALVVANLGRPTDGAPSPRDERAHAGLRNLLAGSPVIAFHASANAFQDADEWEDALGGRWVLGQSWHPPQSRTRVEPGPAASRLPGLSAFDTVDERYLDLRLADKLEVLLEFDDDAGGRAPAMWMRSRAAGVAVYDALGHDVAAFHAPAHLTAIALALDALIDPDPESHPAP